ncbi:hypothetical protein G3N96_24360 [Burkholderia sp. Se-20373]|nr:hypothetical protein [Burkholderia sp. Se-20373]
MAHLKHQIGKLGLRKLKEKWAQLIGSQDLPADLKSQLRTLRLMSKELDESNLEKLSVTYRKSEKSFRNFVESDKRLSDVIADAQAEWNTACPPGQEAMRALSRQAHEWDLDARPAWLRPRITPLLPFIHNIPAVITDYDEQVVKGERARLLEALNWRLTTHDSCDGVEEMEVLDETLERLDAIWNKHFGHLQKRDSWATKFNKAKESFEKVKRDIASELGRKLPESGQFALVKMAELLSREEYEQYRPSFDWLLTREDNNGLLRAASAPAKP